MLLDVRPILHTPGKKLEFQLELDLTDMEFSGRYPVNETVAVTGEVRNTAGILDLDLTTKTVLDAACDRCGGNGVCNVCEGAKAIYSLLEQADIPCPTCAVLSTVVRCIQGNYDKQYLK